MNCNTVRDEDNERGQQEQRGASETIKLTIERR